jgi:hypothetical protein
MRFWLGFFNVLTAAKNNYGWNKFDSITLTYKDKHVKASSPLAKCAAMAISVSSSSSSSLVKQPFLSHSLPLKNLLVLLLVFRKNNSFTVQGRQPCVKSPTWRTRSLHLSPLVTGWPSYTPRHRVTFLSHLYLTEQRWRYSNPPQTTY